MIYSWLKPPDPTTDYNTAIETRQVGTGDWFIRREGFVHWMKTAGSFLWIHGIRESIRFRFFVIDFYDRCIQLATARQSFGEAVMEKHTFNVTDAPSMR